MALSRQRFGFTLVETIITMGILALVATIAFPSYVRIRKRAQAVRILEGLRLIENAKDQWAVEGYHIAADTTPPWNVLRPYVKSSSYLGRQEGENVIDLIGNPYIIGSVSIPPAISEATYDNFEGYVTDEFWGPYWKYDENFLNPH